MTNKLVNSYINYVSKRSAIRRRQRSELQEELAPLLKEFGRAVIDEQKNGKRIEDIEYAIGTKNRTLIYDAKRAAKGLEPREAPTPQPTPENPSESRWEVVGPVGTVGYRIWDAFIVGVYKGSVQEVPDNLGAIEIPDYWAADTENQDLYREIIAHIKTQV